MKVFALIAAASLAVVSAADPPCDLEKLRPLISTPTGKGCQDASGWSVLTFTFPSQDLLKKMCPDKNCQAFLAEMTAAVPTECLVGTIPVKATLIDKFGPACKALEAPAPTPAPAPGPTTAPTPAPAPGVTTAKPEVTTAKPEVTTAKPEATTAKPEATTAKPEATSKAPEATSQAPTSAGSQQAGSMGSTEIDEPEVATKAPTAKPKTPAPTPTPSKSSASTIGAAAGAIAAAVAASFF